MSWYQPLEEKVSTMIFIRKRRQLLPKKDLPLLSLLYKEKMHVQKNVVVTPLPFTHHTVLFSTLEYASSIYE